MNILQIPNNQPVIIDTRIFVYANQRISNQCIKLLEKCAKGEILGVIPVHVLTKLIEVLMIEESLDLGLINRTNSIKQLGDYPNKIKSLNRYESLVKDLLSIGLQLESICREDLLTSFKIQRQFGFRLNDSLFLAIAERLRITAIVSTNNTFMNIRGVIVYSPDDLISE